MLMKQREEQRQFCYSYSSYTRRHPITFYVSRDCPLDSMRMGMLRVTWYVALRSCVGRCLWHWPEGVHSQRPSLVRGEEGLASRQKQLLWGRERVSKPHESVQ